MTKRPVLLACALLTLAACDESPPDFVPEAGSFSASTASIEGVAGPRTVASVDSTFFGRNLPMLGRRFLPTDYGSARPVAVLPHAFWMERFDGRPDVIGTEIDVDGVARTVVGIMPRGVDVPPDVALWIPRWADRSP